MWQMERFAWHIHLPVSVGPDGGTYSADQIFDFGIRPYQTSLLPAFSDADPNLITRVLRTQSTQAIFTWNMTAVGPATSRGGHSDWDGIERTHFQMSNTTSPIHLPRSQQAQCYAFLDLFRECSSQLDSSDSIDPTLSNDTSKCIESFWRKRHFEKLTYPERYADEPDMEKSRPWSQLCEWRKNGELKCGDDIGRIVIERWNRKSKKIKVQGVY